jgi:hypothetical protein
MLGRPNNRRINLRTSRMPIGPPLNPMRNRVRAREKQTDKPAIPPAAKRNAARGRLASRIDNRLSRIPLRSLRQMHQVGMQIARRKRAMTPTRSSIDRAVTGPAIGATSDVLLTAATAGIAGKAIA